MTTSQSSVPAPGRGVKAPEITRDIYGMPAFATLLVADIDATVSWYTDGLGFINLFTIPAPDGSAALVHLRRWRFQDLLVRPSSGPVNPGSGPTLSFAAVYDEVEGLAARARAHGGGIVEGPVDTPWNTRDLTTTDPDGNEVIFTAGLPPELMDARFSDQMDRWNSEQGLPSATDEGR
ncbi:MAG: VOC family protein [Actinomycetota bacterium]|nr:VOC family protein [Actinomycetota bacterium]